jgi:predicted membrane-bound spermidine synthase
MTTFELGAKAEQAFSRAAQPARWIRIICILFFFSGFPALIYQLTWQRALFRIFGVNMESVTIVVTAFMLGLGLGSLAGGWLSKRRGVALLPLLAAIELLTGAFGALSLGIFQRVGELVIGWPLFPTAAVTLALVIVPTLLMGATLPILVGHLVRRSGNVGGAVGLLYYVNTLGAGAACLACTVFLFPFFGMQGAVYVGVGINSAVALGALLAYWRDPRSPVDMMQDKPVAAGKNIVLGFAPTLMLAAAGGFVSLSYEIFFFRTVSYASGSNSTAFAVTLSAFLIGLASGARQAGRDCTTLSQETLMQRPLAALIVATLVALLFLPVINYLASVETAAIGVAILAVYLFARFWGTLLPYLAEMAIAGDAEAGMRTAALYLANIAGSAVGAILTGFVLMDYFGLVKLSAVLALAGLACAALLTAALPFSSSQKTVQASLAAAVGVLALLAGPRLSDSVLENLQWKSIAHSEHLVDVVENRSGIVTATDAGTVFGNGIYDGRFNTDLVHDTNGIVRPYALSLFHPAPRDVLVIGLASGSWTQVLAQHPDVRSVTIVEINPAYVSLIAKRPEVASLLTNPKVTIVTDDGRRWLRANPGRRFDAIVSNTTYYFRANVANLLSTEFLALTKRHLNPGGVLFYNTTDSARVQRTGCLSFAHGARFINHMVLSEAPIRWDFARWRRALEQYRMNGRPVFDLTREADRTQLDGLMSWEANLSVGSGDSERPIEDCGDILLRTAGQAPVTDDNMGSEWLHFFGRE